jgi:GNAT superfamily N-acetyltransferase
MTRKSEKEPSMPVVIKPAETKREMMEFIKFPFSLYRDDPLWIPPLISQEKSQFDPAKNPAYRYCDAAFFIARRDNKPVGRIAVIINRRYIEKIGKNCGRFGWFECEDNRETADALFGAAEDWLLQKGMIQISGPMGFTDNDMTGFLIDGFEELPTIAGSYNPPWYNEAIESRGYVKEVDYVEFLITVPEALPEKVERLTALIKRRSTVKVFNEKSTRALSEKWGHKIFDVLNESYRDLYGTTMLDEKEIDFYIKSYLGQVDPEFIKLAVDGDKLVGFIIAMPNLSRAFQKAKGRLFPFGFIHILREMKTSKVLDFYLAGIRPEYQGKGIDALMTYEMGQSAFRRGMQFAESNHELEDNKKIQAMWKLYEKRLHRRIRVYHRPLGE